MRLTFLLLLLLSSMVVHAQTDEVDLDEDFKSELISENITYSPRLIKTFWDQETPWNTYSKYLINKNGVKELAPAGCSVIAVGQYLYYTHYKDYELGLG